MYTMEDDILKSSEEISQYSFQDLKVGDYFYFYTFKHQLRRKVSIKKYIWVYDGDTKYCKSLKDEEKITRWKVTRKYINKCTKVENFKY